MADLAHRTGLFGSTRARGISSHSQVGSLEDSRISYWICVFRTTVDYSTGLSITSRQTARRFSLRSLVPYMRRCEPLVQSTPTIPAQRSRVNRASRVSSLRNERIYLHWLT